MILGHCSWIDLSTPGGLCRLLERLEIHYKRGRNYVHSPDPHYEAKLLELGRLTSEIERPGNRSALLYMDQVTTYRQPSLAQAYEASGRTQPLARMSHRSNTVTRVVGSLDHRDGRVLFKRGSRIGVDALVAFFRQLDESYPDADVIYVVADNWPVHAHPDVLVALQPQTWPWPPRVPSSWPSEASAKARRKWGDLNLPIQLVFLPTYASWLNPIEKLWRLLKQKLLHLHLFADDLAALRAAIDEFLKQFAPGSTTLLKYVGLATE